MIVPAFYNLQRKGDVAFCRVSACLDIYACVPGSNATEICVVFAEKYPCFSLLNANGGLVELMLKPVYRG